MRAQFSEEFIERVRHASDIAEVVGRHVQLQRKGQNLWGLCPFHSEKTPSFSVSPSKQMYYCFGCHAHGTVFNFIMETERLSFPEAVRALADRANIPIEEDIVVSPEARERQRQMKLLHRVSQWAADIYHEQLLRAPEAVAARSYLQRRGLDAELIRAARLGYALPDWTGLLRAAERSKVPLEALVKLGLAIPRQQKQGHYDRFRGRVIIPIADQRGRVVAFGGRAIDDTHPKYLNSPEHQLFSKGKLLYGLHNASKSIVQLDQVVLMEGYMDCLAAWQHGILNAVASLGTAFTPLQARLIGRYTRQVVICYDGDEAGLQAALRAAEILQQAALEVRVAVLPAGEDPDDCLRKRGSDYFRQRILGQASTLLDFKLDMLRKQFNLSDINGKAEFVTAATAELAKVDNAVLRASYAERIAHQLQVSTDAVMIELAKHEQSPRGKAKNSNGNSRNTNEGSVVSMAESVDPIARGCLVAENTLLGLLLQNLVGAEELLLAWQAENVYAHPADRQLVSLMLQQIQSGHAIEVGRMLEQIADRAAAQRLAEVALAEAPPMADAEVVAQDCLQKLKLMAIRQAIARVQGQLVATEDDTERRRLLHELQLLIEKQKALRH
ncbi:MAG: DNA primase [Bacillota bacterium]|jgi:DNA primase